MPKPNKSRAMKPAMMGLIGPMALMLATLTAVSKESSGEGPSVNVAGGSANRVVATSPRMARKLVRPSPPIFVRYFGVIRDITLLGGRWMSRLRPRGFFLGLSCLVHRGKVLRPRLMVCGGIPWIAIQTEHSSPKVR